MSSSVCNIEKPVTIEAIRLLNNDDSIEECIEWVFKIGMETSLIGKSATIDDVKDLSVIS